MNDVLLYVPYHTLDMLFFSFSHYFFVVQFSYLKHVDKLC